ncbi:hypothetical protein [Streptacidiphilus sp. EB129]|uniref:hypothetical protein n=1 Tax=Streptacidiphilus sp. EB129 TaxID=3156262 RepID=UPI0035141ADB
MAVEKKIIRLHLEPGEDGVTLSVSDSVSAERHGQPVVENTVITEATVIEVEVEVEA